MFKFLTVVVLVFGTSAFAQNNSRGNLRSHSIFLELTATKSVFPAQEFDLLFSYKDELGFLITKFDVNHEKENHAIIVSKDLESFVHLHPKLQSTGYFSLTLNSLKPMDADNIDAYIAVPKPGTYFVFTEVIRQGSGKVDVVTDELIALGKENYIPLLKDSFIDDQSVKYFKSNGDEGFYGDAYRATLTVQKMTSQTVSPTLHFNFKIEEWMTHGSMSHYMVVGDLQPWLGMAGHGILISEQGNKVDEKIFRHLHAMTGTDAGGGHHHMRDSNHDHPALVDDPISAVSLDMELSGSAVPVPGVYKLWGQFKHKNRVLTFPYILEL